MTCAMYSNQNMSCYASAPCANAASFCANIAIILDAMILASILIICALIGLSILGISLVAAVVLLYTVKVNMRRAQRFS